MLSPVNPPSHHDDPATVRRARAGLTLFFLYVVLYAGFIGLVLVRPEWLSWRPFGGVNLAIAYGLGLIAAALALAAIYMAACRWADRRSSR